MAACGTAWLAKAEERNNPNVRFLRGKQFFLCPFQEASCSRRQIEHAVDLWTFKTPHMMKVLSMTLQSWLEWSLRWGNSLGHACHNTWQHIIKRQECLCSKLCTGVCHNSVCYKHQVVFWQGDTMSCEDRLECMGQILQQSTLLSQQNSPPCWAWICTPAFSALQSDFTPFSPVVVFSEGGSGHSFIFDSLIHRYISFNFLPFSLL